MCLASVAAGALLALIATQLVLSRGRSGLGAGAPMLRVVAIGVPILNVIPQLLLVFKLAAKATADAQKQCQAALP